MKPRQSRLVNHGSPIRWIEDRIEPGPDLAPIIYHRAEHEGVENHDLLAPGDQCECGYIALGLITGASDASTG